MPNEFTLFSVAESPDAKGHGSSLRTVIIAAVVVFLVGTLSWIIYRCRKKGVSSSWLFHPMTTNYSISVNGNYIFFFFFFFRMKKNLTLIVIKCFIRSVFSRAAFVLLWQMTRFMLIYQKDEIQMPPPDTQQKLWKIWEYDHNYREAPAKEGLQKHWCCWFTLCSHKMQSVFESPISIRSLLYHSFKSAGPYPQLWCGVTEEIVVSSTV